MRPRSRRRSTDIQAALRDYIEATYHVGHPTVIEQREHLLRQEGVLFREPYIESTPRYRTDRKFADLELDPAVAEPLAQLTEVRRPRSAALRPAVHAPGGSRGVGIARRIEPGGHDRHRLGQDGVVPASDARQAGDRGGAPSRVVRHARRPGDDPLPDERPGQRPARPSAPAARRPARHRRSSTAWAGRPARFARYTSRTLYPGVRTRRGPAAPQFDRGLLRPAP